MRLQKRRVLGSAVLGLGAAMAIAGCGAGQITQTDTQQPSVNGAYAQVGKLVVRDAALVNRNQCEQAYTQGSDAPLSMALINQSANDDQLESVSSELSDGAEIKGSRAVPGASRLMIAPSQEQTAEQAAAPTSGSRAPGGVSAQGTFTTQENGQQGGQNESKVGHGEIVLKGLKGVVWPGQWVRVTLTFRDAGPVTLDLPIAAPSPSFDSKTCEKTVHTESGGH